MYEKCIQNGFNVRKEDIRLLLSILDPENVEKRKSRRLLRRNYYNKGPNYIWHMDSYDKLKRYGICINGCVDGFSRKVLWLKAYSTSSDPKVIAGYFMEAVDEYKGCPRIIRADKGTENADTCTIQRLLRQDGTDTFAGEKSFLYGRSTMNQRIEYWWSFLRKECTEFWIDFLTGLKNEGHYDGDFIDKNLIIFSFLGIIQVFVHTAA